MIEPVDVSIIVRVRNEHDALVRTLDELAKQSYSGTTEIIVIDNESTDGSQAAALARGARVFSLPRNMFTYGRAINVGIARAKGSMLVLLSSHAWPSTSDWLERMVDWLHSSEQTMGVFCKQIPIEELGHREALRFEPFSRPTFTLTEGLIKKRLADGERLYDASYFSNSAVILRKSAAEAFPMRDLPYAEENAFALDCILMGMQVVYASQPTAYYRGPVSSKGLYHQARRQMIAEKLIEQEYAKRFDPDYRFGVVNLRALGQAALLPVHFMRLAWNIAFDPRYTVGARARTFDRCALAGVLGRLVGACTWRRYRHTMMVDLLKLAEANRALVEIA